MTEPARADVFIATSLDGFIAREDGALDWLPVPGGAPGDEDYGYRAFFDSVDALVMGRNTFDVALGFGTWPYGEKPVYVLTHRPLVLPDALAGEPESVARALAARGVRRFYADGGVTVQQFLAAGLVDRLIVTRVPVLIGRGIPLFGPLADGDVRLRHVTTRSWQDGLVQSEYAVEPAAPRVSGS